MKTVNEYLKEAKKSAYVKQVGKFWTVMTPSPTAKSGFISQGEWKTEKEAQKDLKANWLKESLDEATNSKYQDIIRYVPTGSKVITNLSDKSLRVTIVNPISAPPLTTKDVPRIESQLKKDVGLLIKDIKTEITIKGVDEDKYVFIEGKEGKILVSFSFTITVANKTEGKKLKTLDSSMEFYKKKKI